MCTNMEPTLQPVGAQTITVDSSSSKTATYITPTDITTRASSIGVVLDMRTTMDHFVFVSSAHLPAGLPACRIHTCLGPLDAAFLFALAAGDYLAEQQPGAAWPYVQRTAPRRRFMAHICVASYLSG